MANTESSIAYENLNRRIFPGVGEYGIPRLEAETFDGNCEFVGFNYARGNCRNPEKKAVHFFIDDYQFDALWRNVDRYVDKLRQFQYVLTPDFSTYTDFPKAIQIYNHYRKHWVGAYLQEYGCRVIPTISMEHTRILCMVLRWGARGRHTGGFFGRMHEQCRKKKSVFIWVRGDG